MSTTAYRPRSDLQTVELSDEFLETIYLHGRVYQRYAIENGAYFGPVDEVGSHRILSLFSRDI